MTNEIERKFVPADPPAVDEPNPGTELRQGYLAQEGQVEVRVRITGPEAQITIKAGTGKTRVEIERAVTLAEAEAEALWPYTEGRRIAKTRYRVPVAGHVAEIDRYHGQLDRLWTIEVEFPDERQADDFQPPAWFGREVTGDPAWSNASLARHGLPER